jgi:hypothetical protein
MGAAPVPWKSSGLCDHTTLGHAGKAGTGRSAAREFLKNYPEKCGKSEETREQKIAKSTKIQISKSHRSAELQREFGGGV